MKKVDKIEEENKRLREKISKLRDKIRELENAVHIDHRSYAHNWNKYFDEIMKLQDQIHENMRKLEDEIWEAFEE